MVLDGLALDSSAIKIAMVTGSRADWGLLRAVARRLSDDPAFRLSVIATGSHLSPRYGMTVDDIRRDGFELARQVPILDDGDDAAAVTRAMARAVTGIGAALADLAPDLVLVLGDRYEILAAAQACLVARIPVAHLCGGDITEGAMDDCIRHAITKLSHLHFVSNAPARRRVMAMGEEPHRVILTGSPGLDSIREVAPLSRSETFAALALAPKPQALLVTFHPATLDETPGEQQFAELAAALDSLGPGVALILTGSNADAEGQRLTQLAQACAQSREHAIFRVSLGQKLYLSAMAHVDAVIGNSSSGLYEAPSFGIPTVNIGDRQAGRLRATSVIDVAPQRDAIAAAIRLALASDCAATLNPYGDGHAAEKIVAGLKAMGMPAALLRKRFYDGESR